MLFQTSITAAAAAAVIMMGSTLAVFDVSGPYGGYPPADGQPITGDGTNYTPGLGACGETNGPDDMIVAVGWNSFDNFPGATGDSNSNPICNQVIEAKYGQKSVKVTVKDRCAGCAGPFSLDFSPAALAKLVDDAENVGRIHGVTWTMSGKAGTFDVQWPVIVGAAPTQPVPLPKTWSMSGPKATGAANLMVTGAVPSSAMSVPTGVTDDDSTSTVTATATVNPQASLGPPTEDDTDDADADPEVPITTPPVKATIATPAPASAISVAAIDMGDSATGTQRRRAFRFARDLKC